MSAIAFRICAFSLVCTFAIARSSSADPVVIYSNFGAPPGYLVGTGWQNSDENAYYMGFQLSETAQLSSVVLPVVWGGTLPGGFSVSVWTSSGGAPEFTTTGLLERMVVPVPADAQPRNVSMLTLQSAVQPVLSANTLYFLGAFVTAPVNDLTALATLWPWNNAGIRGVIVNNTPGDNFVGQGTLGAFQLNGEHTPVPEPGTMLLMATGAGLIAQRVRRRRRI